MVARAWTALAQEAITAANVTFETVLPSELQALSMGSEKEQPYTLKRRRLDRENPLPGEAPHMREISFILEEGHL